LDPVAVRAFEPEWFEQGHGKRGQAGIVEAGQGYTLLRSARTGSLGVAGLLRTDCSSPEIGFVDLVRMSQRHPCEYQRVSIARNREIIVEMGHRFDRG